MFVSDWPPVKQEIVQQSRLLPTATVVYSALSLLLDRRKWTRQLGKVVDKKTNRQSRRKVDKKEESKKHAAVLHSSAARENSWQHPLPLL